MIHNRESICSYEQSNLLKRLGFDWDCSYLYYNTITGVKLLRSCVQPSNHNAGIYISAPSYSMVLCWLREVHNIVIVVEPKSRSETIEYSFYFYSTLIGGVTGWSENEFKTYEEAEETAIQHALEQIESNNHELKKYKIDPS